MYKGVVSLRQIMKEKGELQGNNGKNLFIILQGKEEV